MTVNILGTEYTVEYKTDEEVAEDMGIHVGECDGYCDSYKNLIVIAEQNTYKGDDKEGFIREQMREALIIAFANESGVDDEMAPWIAKQFPKLLKTFKEVGAIEGCGCKCQKQPNGQEIMDAVIAGKTLAEAAKMHDVKCPEESELKKACDEVLDTWTQLSEEDKIKYSNSVYTYEKLKTAAAKRKAEKKCDEALDKFLED